MIHVYYDGKCGLCAREIKHYQSIAPENTFLWCDITEDSSELEAMGVDYVYGLKRLHAKDTMGNLHSGADAFILIWSHLKHWKYLAAIGGLPIIRQIARLCYNLFADWKFKNASHCQIALKESKSD